MRSVGWRYESHRHALAAKGISTRRYRSSAVPDRYDRAGDALKWMVSDGRAKVPDFHEQRKDAVMQEISEEYGRNFSDAEARGELRKGACQSFMDDDLTTEMKDFKDGYTDEHKLRDNLHRRAEKHKSMWSTHPFTFGGIGGMG